jgi:hypothetical protein
MTRKTKLDLNALQIDSFATAERPTVSPGTVFGNVPTADCPSGAEPSWDAGCTIGCLTRTNYDGPTCGVADCGGGSGGATWNHPSCPPNYTCANPTCMYNNC